jgi:ABC-type phosphate/phosphonate transport system substrate-binding protein
MIDSRAIAADSPLIVVVMDPLSAPLACDCVKGYAQRKYELLGAFLQNELHRPVKVFWSESLVKALQNDTNGQVDLIIGKDSVVRFDAKVAKLSVTPIAALTGKDGETTQTGLVVVRNADSANALEDLTGYRIFFGPEDCDEKWSAPRELLQEHGLDVAKLDEKYPACSAAADALVKLPQEVKGAAIISSYAEPLLEGCGTVKKGDLRVIGRTKPLPFVTAFVNDQLDQRTRSALQAALMKVGEQPDLLIGLETLGFVPMEEAVPTQTTAAKKKS